MASKLIQVQSKACEASKFVAKHGTSYYRQLLEKNKHFIQEPATVDKCQELSKQLLYTRLARSLTLSSPFLILSKSQSYTFMWLLIFSQSHLVHAAFLSLENLVHKREY